MFLNYLSFHHDLEDRTFARMSYSFDVPVSENCDQDLAEAIQTIYGAIKPLFPAQWKEIGSVTNDAIRRGYALDTEFNGPQVDVTATFHTRMAGTDLSVRAYHDRDDQKRILEVYDTLTGIAALGNEARESHRRVMFLRGNHGRPNETARSLIQRL